MVSINLAVDQSRGFLVGLRGDMEPFNFHNFRDFLFSHDSAVKVDVDE